jgi:hypothetical protein
MSDQQLAVLIAGIIWPAIFAALRRFHRLSGRPAQWVAVLLCYGIAAAADFTVTRQPVTVDAVLTHGSEIALLAQVVYRQAIKPYFPADSSVPGPGPKPDTPAPLGG